MIARPVTELTPIENPPPFPAPQATGVYVCRDDSLQDPAEDCFNPLTGIYEKKHVLEFFDIEEDPFEEEALVLSEMSSRQRMGFFRLCAGLNRISARATYFQNGKVCDFHGANLVGGDM